MYLILTTWKAVNNLYAFIFCDLYILMWSLPTKRIYFQIERSVEVRQYDLDHPHDPYKWGRGWRGSGTSLLSFECGWLSYSVGLWMGFKVQHETYAGLYKIISYVFADYRIIIYIIDSDLFLYTRNLYV